MTRAVQVLSICLFVLAPACASLDLPHPPEAPLTLTPLSATDISNATRLPVQVKFEGSGDSEITVPPHESSLLRISGNSLCSHFTVEALDSRGRVNKLLVETESPYTGLRPLDFRQDEETARLRIRSTGPWTVEVLPLDRARRIHTPGEFDGSGDDVVIIQDGSPDRARISGNTAAAPFRVTSFFDDSRVDLLVDTTQPFDGSVSLSGTAVVMVIKATGPWSIELTDSGQGTSADGS